jgi:hypothetical protein
MFLLATLAPLLQLVALGALGGIISIAAFQIRRRWRNRRGRKRVQVWIPYLD